MDNLQGTPTWRSLLGQFIKNVQERERLAAAIGIQPVTLVRWATGAARPRAEHMKKLLKMVAPADFATFMYLLTKEFPDFAEERELNKRIQSEVPPAFYEQILSAHARTPQPMCRQVIQDLVLQQAIEHLDPNRIGLSINIATFVHPLEGARVRSLREIGGIGTPPWPHDLTQRTIFLGAESLVGYAITQLNTLVVANRSDTTFFPVHWTEHEQSAAAVPILRHGKVAGGLIAGSAVPDYFLPGSPSVSLLEEYANLAAFIFELDEFFAPNEITLGFLPAYELQIPYFRDFSRLVSQQFRLEQVRGSHFTLEQARRQVWREIEEALLQVYLQTSHLL